MDQYDPEAETLVALATLRGIPANAWTAEPISDIALRLHRVRALGELCQEIVAELETAMVSAMPDDEMVVAGLGPVRRVEARSSSWAFDGAAQRMRDDLARSVANRLATDLLTGEIDKGKWNVAMAALRMAYKAIPGFSSLKVEGRRELA